MDDVQAAIRAVLDASGLDYEIMPCDPDLADTAVFCERYGIALEDSANTILVKTKTGVERFVACVVLATTRLDVNKAVRKRIGARKVSFAGPEGPVAGTGNDHQRGNAIPRRSVGSVRLLGTTEGLR